MYEVDVSATGYGKGTDDHRKRAFRELAGWLENERVSCSVLHGIDATSGALGRDLDLYVEGRADAFKTAIAFSQILQLAGYRWVVLPHPIWGPRCVGIRGENLDYAELHVVTRLRFGPLDANKYFSLRPEQGSLGFPYDPVLMLFKQVIMKWNRKILRSAPLWSDRQPPLFLIERIPLLDGEMERLLPKGNQFVESLLGADTRENRRLRRHGLMQLLAATTMRDPASSLRMLTEYATKRIERFHAVAGPMVVVAAASNMSVDQLRDELDLRLSGIFRHILVSDIPIPWARRRWEQSRQTLLVHVVRAGRVSNYGSSPIVYAEDHGSLPDLANHITQVALDEIVALSQRHEAIYGDA